MSEIVFQDRRIDFVVKVLAENKSEVGSEGEDQDCQASTEVVLKLSLPSVLKVKITPKLSSKQNRLII